MSLKKVIDKSFELALPAWGAVIVVYGIIIATLRNGISCDEGYYLMGYLKQQPIGSLCYEFHYMVKAIGAFLPDNDIMTFRYMRFFLFIPTILFFAWAAYKWLSKELNLDVTFHQITPLILLGGAWCYTFAAPTISYDSLQTIIYLLAISLTFIYYYTDKYFVKTITSIGVGFVLWFGFANNIASGACLIILLLVWHILYNNTIKWKEVIFSVIGMMIAMVAYNFTIHNIQEFFLKISDTIISVFTETSQSDHDAKGFLVGIAKALGHLFIFLIPTIGIVWLVTKKIKTQKWVQYIISFCLLVIVIFIKNLYKLESIILLLPIMVILGVTISEQPSRQNFLTKEKLIPFIIMACLPIAGVMGTNQSLLIKAVTLAPLWIICYFILLSALQKTYRKVEIIFVAILFFGYVYLGNFSRYHYYYTPHSSKYELIGNARKQTVLVSGYQQQYYQDIFDTIHSRIKKVEPLFIGFGEHQMTGYLAGGYFDGGLVYHWWQYCYQNENQPDFFLLFKNEEKDVINYFKGIPWNFPDEYERIEMRKMSENMSSELNTVLYILKQNTK